MQNGSKNGGNNGGNGGSASSQRILMFLNSEKSLQKRLDLWAQKGIITPLQAAQIQDLERTSHQGRAQDLLKAIGFIMLGAGLVFLVAHNWSELARELRALVAFAIVALSLALNLWAHSKGSAALKQGAALFWALGFGAAFAIISQSYHLSSSEDDFIFWWLALCAPLIFLDRSKLLCFLYLVIGSVWYAGAEDHARFALLALPFALCFARTLIKKENSFAPVAALALSLFLWIFVWRGEITSTQIAFLYGFYFLLGEIFYAKAPLAKNPLFLISFAIAAFVVLFSDAFYYDKDKTRVAIASGLFLGAFLLWLGRMQKERILIPLSVLCVSGAHLAGDPALGTYLALAALIGSMFFAYGTGFFKIYATLFVLLLTRIFFDFDDLLTKATVFLAIGAALVFGAKILGRRGGRSQRTDRKDRTK